MAIIKAHRSQYDKDLCSWRETPHPDTGNDVYLSTGGDCQAQWDPIDYLRKKKETAWPVGVLGHMKSEGKVLRRTCRKRIVIIPRECNGNSLKTQKRKAPRY